MFPEWLGVAQVCDTQGQSNLKIGPPLSRQVEEDRFVTVCTIPIFTQLFSSLDGFS